VVTVCLSLAPGNKPVEETWELINVASEHHNFHMHQTKFRVVLPSPQDSNEAGALVDNLPLYNGGANVRRVGWELAQRRVRGCTRGCTRGSSYPISPDR
jgi:hypothetical protein